MTREDLIGYIQDQSNKVALKQFYSDLKFLGFMIALVLVVGIFTALTQQIKDVDQLVVIGLVFLTAAVGWVCIKYFYNRTFTANKLIHTVAATPESIVWVHLWNVQSRDMLTGTIEDSYVSLRFVDTSKHIYLLKILELPEGIFESLNSALPNADIGYSFEKEEKYLLS
jgi:hypothetical protein